ncbi:MAG: hypothetical protein J6X74_02205 [Bacteroidaceae bacterium]|nr:hypothetical protein [Bacteroidaceae bacterium]
MLLLTLVSCQEKRLDRFEREALDYTLRNCPHRLDPITTLDSVVFHNDGTLDYIYYYTVSLDSQMIETFRKKSDDIAEITLRNVRNNIDLKAVKESGLNIIYLYRDSLTGKTIQTFRFTKEQYQ